jgi:hypothetical protein
MMFPVMTDRKWLSGVILSLLLVLLSGCGTESERTEFCVRAGAKGGDGSNWDSAFSQLPKRLKRGATYYIAAGTYPSYRFNERERGTNWIVIKKATTAEHGPSEGWKPEFASGPIVWLGPLYVDSSNWIFDGVQRNETNWFDGASYGFQIWHNENEQQMRLGSHGRAVTNVELHNIYFLARNSGLSTTVTGRRYGLDIDTMGGSGTFTGLKVSRCFFQFGNVPIFSRNNDGMIVEYSAFDANESNAANHGEAMSAYYSNRGLIIRYNQFRSITGTAVIAFSSGASHPVEGFEIYGNVIWNCNLGDGVFGFDREEWPFANTKIYNNTIARKAGGLNSGIAIRSGHNNQVFNNLWIDCGDGFWNGAGAEYSHNAYSWSWEEADAQTNITPSIFVDYARDDFRLRSATHAGRILAAPFDRDLTGEIRGDDGEWDRGAFEFCQGNSLSAGTKK